MALSGYLRILCAASLWGLIGPVAKIALAAGMPPLEVAFWRTASGWLFFALQALFAGQYRVAGRDMPLVLAFGLFGVAGLFGTYVLAVRDGGAALASVLLYTAPAWVAVMSRFLFRESMGPAKILALIMTMTGVACVCLGPGAGAEHIGPAAVFFGLASGLSYALYYIFGKQYLGRYSTPTLFLWAMPVGALALLPSVTFHAWPFTVWLAVVTLGFCSTWLAYSIYYSGLRHLEATRAAVVATMEPVVAAVLAWIMWDERFSLLGYVGSGLILAAVLVTMRPARRMPGVETEEVAPADAV
ncbi:protein of unknown function DUF6 transmembrane [Desulfovibrio sp. X2]|uniref:DMT family transporter n=1 Tax=Desulfovibrio sp. X2 TaxID=941449 RepID=UPI000358ABEF|nr:EamA family transporter [Desulfovibrio sp. X2]EPR39360.1 protein of unknown function DUF6 transmembrane [Desulfovibrio sp. X2]